MTNKPYHDRRFARRPLALAIAAIAAGGVNLHAADSTRVLEEIVVTAEKRENNLQDTAIAISAYTGDNLEALKIDDVQGLILRDPSMSFSRAGGEGQGQEINPATAPPILVGKNVTRFGASPPLWEIEPPGR